jgi:hypothetical protein
MINSPVITYSVAAYPYVTMTLVETCVLPPSGPSLASPKSESFGIIVLENKCFKCSCFIGYGHTTNVFRTNAASKRIQLWTMPLYQGGLRRCHISSGSRPHLPIKVGSSAATCPEALDLAFLLERAPVLSRVLWLLTPPS